MKKAEETAQFLRTLRQGPAWIVSSDLPSAKQTAKIYAKALGVKAMRPMKDLRGMDIDGFAGKSKEEAEARLKECFKHPDQPCGRNGETPNHFDQRCAKVFAAIARTARKTGALPLVVAHGSNTVFPIKNGDATDCEEPPVLPAGILKLTDTAAVPIFKEDLKQKPIIMYPADHQVGMAVPKGGSNCAKCEYVHWQAYTNEYLIAWDRGSNIIPGPGIRTVATFSSLRKLGVCHRTHNH